jgi:hypothetical protein
MAPPGRLISDSVWCGGAACVSLVVMDALALWHGGRHEVPASGLWVAVGGLVLPLLNLYFIVKDLIAGRRRAAALGAMLSLLALLAAFNPPWARHVIRANTLGLPDARYGRS